MMSIDRPRWPATRLARSTLAALLGIACLAPAATGQSAQPVVLVHGFNSNGDTWTSAAARLRQEFNATTTQPTLPWGHDFGDQANRLRGSLAWAPWAYPDTTVLVGHSNGGLISREANRQGQPVKAVITVGTLHGGAPLAATFGVLPPWGGFIAAVNFDPIYYYMYWLGDWNWISWIASSQAAVMSATGAFMAGYGSFILTQAISGALPDMSPGSPFLDRLNAQENINREAGSIPVRVGIQSYVNDPFYGIMFQGLLGANGSADYLTAIQYSSIFWDLVAFEYYSSFWFDWEDPWAWDKAIGAFLWLNAAYTTASIDPVWCSLAGISVANGCEPSDGIVPLRNQYYPGGQNYTVRGPAHTDETSSRTTVDQLVSVLRYSVGVGAPVYVPPPTYEPPPYEPPPTEPCYDHRLICEQPAYSMSGGQLKPLTAVSGNPNPAKPARPAVRRPGNPRR